MDILIPQALANLTSNLTGSPLDEWSDVTTYAVDDEIKVSASSPPSSVTHTYRSLVAGNLNNDPASSPDKWLDLGPDNLYAMLDDRGGTYSVSDETDVPLWSDATTYAKYALVLVQDGDHYDLYQSRQNSNLNHAPASSASWWLPIGTAAYPSSGQLVLEFYTLGSDVVVVLGMGDVDAVYVRQAHDASSQDMVTGRQDIVIPIGDGDNPDLPSAVHHISVIMLRSATSANATCGSLFACRRLASIGTAKYGANTGIIDFSKKITDDFGQTYLRQGSYAKRATLDIDVPSSQMNEVYRTLVSVRGQAVVWYEPEGQFEPLLIYGFFKEFSIVIAGPSVCKCSLEIEGLT